MLSKQSSINIIGYTNIEIRIILFLTLLQMGIDICNDLYFRCHNPYFCKINT